MTTTALPDPASRRTLRPTTPRSPLARLGHAALNAVVLVVVVSALLYVLAAVSGYDRYVITGGSMSGSIEKGSVVLAREVPVEDLRIGDVITYLPPAETGLTSLVTHRIVEIDTAGGRPLFRTQGDANADPDPWTFVLDQPTQPVVEHAVPQLGYVFVALADRTTRVLTVGIPAGVIALLSLVELLSVLRGARPAGAVASPSGAAIAPGGAGLGTPRRPSRPTGTLSDLLPPLPPAPTRPFGA